MHIRFDDINHQRDNKVLGGLSSFISMALALLLLPRLINNTGYCGGREGVFVYTAIIQELNMVKRYHQNL